MVDETNWDFRGKQELGVSSSYVSNGYVIADANLGYLASLKTDIENAFNEFNEINYNCKVKLEDAHQVIDHTKSNDLRLFIMQKLFQGTSFHRNYYNASKEIIHSLCGNELAMQKRPGLLGKSTK